MVLLLCFFVTSPSAQATVAPNGMLIYADTTNVGNLKHQLLTSPNTWGGEVSTSVGSASNVRWIVQKDGIARNTKIAALLKADGSMDVLLYNATSTNAWTLQFTVTGVGVTVAPFTRAMDIFTERLSGELVIVYGKTGTNGSFFYRVWNGNTWTNETSQAISGMLGPAHWIGATGRSGTDEGAIAVIDGTNDDAFAVRWNGSSWVNNVMLTNSLPTVETERAAVEFEANSGKILAVYSNVTANNAAPWKSNVFNGTSWGATTTLPNAGASSIGRWVTLDAGPDDLIAFAAQSSDATTLTTSPTFDPYIWSGTASTSAWIKGAGDTSASTMDQRGGTVRWEAQTLNANATPQAVFLSSQSTIALAKEYFTFTYLGGFGALTTITGNNSDDIQYIGANSSKNSSDIMVITNDIDSDLYAQRWNGSSWDTISTARELVIPDGALNTRTTWEAEDFAYDRYTPWMRNWKWLDNTEASVAAENATSSLQNLTTYHLRVNLEETGGAGQFNASKKLQYTTSATPDSSAATWTDVGAQGSGSIWRYVNGLGTELGTISSSVLASTTISGVYFESGFASTTHATSTVTEYDYAIESNGASQGTNYSFRLYDNEFDKSVKRKQDSKIGAKCGTNGLSVCWYPAATIAAGGAPTVTTNAGTNVAVSSGTLNGQITATGGANATVRGFAWGTVSTLSGGDTSTTTESGDFGVATFFQNVSNLLANKTYYFRAYATNPGGTSYGNIDSLLTTTDSTATRRMRLFEGFKINLISGKMILHQK